MPCYGWGVLRNELGQVIRYWIYDYFGHEHIVFDLRLKTREEWIKLWKQEIGLGSRLYEFHQ